MPAGSPCGSTTPPQAAGSPVVPVVAAPSVVVGDADDRRSR
jgi:hypothetical protein